MAKKKDVSPELQQAKESLEDALRVPDAAENPPDAAENPPVVAALFKVNQLEVRVNAMAEIIRQNYGVTI